MCTDTYRHMGAYTMHSVCNCAHLQRQTGTQVGNSWACKCSRVHAHGHMNMEPHIQVWIPSQVWSDTVLNIAYTHTWIDGGVHT